MEEMTTVQAEQSNTTENYTVYDSPDGDEQQEIVGTYITDDVAESLGENIEIELSEGDGSGLSLTQDKETSSFVVFSSDADAVEATYISHEVLEEIGADSDSTLDMLARESTSEAFEEALEEQTTSEEEAAQEADALLAGGGSEEESDDSEEEAEADPQEEEAAELVSDDEVGI